MAAPFPFERPQEGIGSSWSWPPGGVSSESRKGRVVTQPLGVVRCDGRRAARKRKPV
ncbi:hypothetical protein IMZ48_25095 [Candidatus Bathyarchaeota archaeon]|nr:hypothetical protein [Candidatus Bathyarchaeota archaeon]